MAFNRLRLDFSLQTAAERIEFLNNYLPTINFEPNEHEQETLSDYILWGKDPDTGLNAQQDGNLVIKEWAPNTNVESLEGTLEIPGFNEMQMRSLNDTHYKTKRVVFNREDALAKASDEQKVLLQNLFREIDRVELMINYYDLRVGKRKAAPRAQLLKAFTEEERATIQEKADKLIQYKYLKLRHYLVELRNEQYTYRDSFIAPVTPHVAAVHTYEEGAPLSFDTDVEVWPLGLKLPNTLCGKMFQNIIDPLDFTEHDLNLVTKILWRPRTDMELDFTNPDHVLYLYKNYYDIEDAALNDPHGLYGNARFLLDTLLYYQERAELTEIQADILQLKIDEIPNVKIAEIINNKYGSTYNPNYISTIYRKKVIPAINTAASRHRLIMENIFWPDNFKVCSDCGELRLRHSEFFMRQGKSPDGYVPRCKKCQSIKRAFLKAQREERKRIEKHKLENDGSNNQNAAN